MDPQEEEIIADSEDEGHGGMKALERVGNAESPASSALLAAIGSGHADSLATPHINSVVYLQHSRPDSALSNQSSIAMSSTTMTVHYDASVANKWDAVPLPPIAVLPQRSSLSPLSDPPSPITKVALPSAHASDHSSSATNPSSKPRPKPRPIKTMTITHSDDEAHAAVDSVTVDPSHAIPTNNDLFSLSLAERAKLRSRKVKSNTSDMSYNEEAPLPPGTETTNGGSSKRKRDVEKAATLEIIDLSSDDEDELSLRPSAKRQKSPTQRDAVVGATIAIAQNSTELVSAFPSSPLPPSDLPLPTSTATTTDVHFQHMPPEPIFAPLPLLSPPRNRSRDSSVTATETVPMQIVEVVMPSLPYEQPGKTSNSYKEKKPKPPPKSKSKKGAKKDVLEDGGGDVGYNNIAPKSNRAQSKGKKKAAAHEIELKSNEVVANSDEEGDFLDIRKSTSGVSGDGSAHGASAGQATGSGSTAEGEDSSTLSKRKGGKTAKSIGKKAAANPPQVNDENSVSPSSNNPTSATGKTARNRKVIFSDDEDELTAAPPDNLSQKPESRPPTKAKQPKKGGRLKHGHIPPDDDEDYNLAKQKSSNNSRSASPIVNARRSSSPAPGPASPPARKTASALTPHIPSRSYSISAKQRSTPMSELLKRVNSMPSSPFAQGASKSSKPPSTIYSPLLKNSRSALSRIAPLHPNRRTPPPPPPRIPPPPKSKKQIALEEKWMEELEESVEGWSCLPEDEKTALWKAKFAKEMGYDD